MKYVLKIELETDDEVYATDRESVAWLIDDILTGYDTLSLHSDEIGDEIGTVKVLSVKTADGRVVVNKNQE